MAEPPLERRAVISGIGQSAVGRHLGRTDIDLTVEACLAAVADAGLTRDDIDGLATYPGMGAGTAGFAGPSSPEVQDALRLRLNWHDGGGEGPGQMRAVIAACLAVAAGLARHVLVYRTVSESTAQGEGGRQGIGGSGGGGGGVPRFSGFLQWTLPFGAVSAVNWLALVAERRMYEFCLTAPAARPDRHQRPPERRRQPEGRLPRSHGPGRLPRRPHDLHAAVPLRLRRPERRVDRPRGLPPRLRARRARSGLPGQRRGHRAAGSGQLGPVRRPDDHGGPGRGRLHVGADRTAPRRRRRGPALRRLLHPGHGVAGGAGLLRTGRERDLRRERSGHLDGRASCRSTPPGASCPAVASTASVSSTRPACSCGARAGTARCTARGDAFPRWPPSATAAVPSPARCCSPGAPAERPIGRPVGRRPRRRRPAFRP